MCTEKYKMDHITPDEAFLDAFHMLMYAIIFISAMS
jgi:hypothetical protein